MLLKKTLSILVIINSFFLFITSAYAHGGGSLDNGTCFVEMGDFHIGLVGYQPQEHPKDKFCDSFPSLGPTVLTFDFVDAKFREMKTGVKIVEAKNLFEADGVESTEKIITIKEPSIRSKGLMSVSHEFKKPGNFVAMLTVVDSKGNEQVGQFPFSVGASFSQSGPIIVGIVLAFLVFRLYTRIQRRQKKQLV